jgi:hypothetical protein
VSSDVQSLFSFFASQSLHDRFFLKKNPAKHKTAQFFPLIFCFIRELNPHPPLALEHLGSIKPLVLPSHPSAHTSTPSLVRRLESSTLESILYSKKRKNILYSKKRKKALNIESSTLESILYPLGAHFITLFCECKTPAGGRQ